MKKRIKKIRNLTIGVLTILFLGNSFRLIKGNKEALKVVSNHQNSNNHEENIVAHRGFSGIYPDNSYLAISKALELPCVDMIEIDVRLTSDKTIVLHHDKNTSINDLIVSISKVDLTDIEDDLAINDFNLYNLGDINTEDSIFLFSRYLSKSKYQSYLIRLKNILFLFKDSKTLIIDIKTNKVDYQFMEELNNLLEQLAKEKTETKQLRSDLSELKSNLLTYFWCSFVAGISGALSIFTLFFSPSSSVFFSAFATILGWIATIIGLCI